MGYLCKIHLTPHGKGKGKVKVHPRTGHENTVVMYLYSFFNLSARWGQIINATSRPVYPGE